MRKFIGAILFLFCMFADNAGAQVNKQYFVWVGRDMVMDSRYREAIETLNILLRADPDAYEGYFWRGIAKYHLDDLLGAERDFTLTLAKNPVYTNAYQFRALTLVPIVKGERKRRKREEQTKKRYRKKPTDTVRLCADDIMTRLKLKTYQDTYAIAMAKYGLQRGIDGSTARHKSTQQYYRDTQKLVDSLKAEVVDLQERKEAARQELRQAKKEVQTEKLKGAATTAATNIAESVGSFFGSNKVKTLERENKNLHERVSELQEEARQREQQQAKHIQEITDAYELRHRKLSEFTDFVKRYFPYVEKLIPTINFLRERLGFNDDIIRRLCTFKDVPIKGKLHSSEFNQGFETQRAVCSIKEDENGKFDFKIDGVSHISWFRKKMNEFREAIGIPKPRQNRGMQL